MRVRRAKRDRLLAEGRRPYPVAVARTHTLAEVRAAYPDLPTDTATGDRVGVAGRVMFFRNTGKLCFATLQEGDGTQLQVMLCLDRVGEESLAAWKADVDLGDLVFVHGEVISSRRGELSVLADSWQMAAKALRPLPVAHKEMSEEIAGPAALRRPDRAPGGARRSPAPGRRRPRVRYGAGTARLSRGRDADAADAARRRGGAAVRHALQRARHRPVPADRAGTVPQALRRRRPRQGLRDQPQLPQRGRGLHALAGIRDARDLPGVRHLRRFRAS